MHAERNDTTYHASVTCLSPSPLVIIISKYRLYLVTWMLNWSFVGRAQGVSGQVVPGLGGPEALRTLAAT